MRWVWLVALLWACSRGAQADLPSIGDARSLGAEWALINEQAAQGHLTASYVETMHEQLRLQLQSTRHSLTQSHSTYAHEIDELLHEPANASPEALRVHVANLKRVEDALESA